MIWKRYGEQFSLEKWGDPAMLKISVITVSYNAAATIEQTILSVVGQAYPYIEYIIIDGGSTDGTVDIIRKYEDKIAYWVSEPDNGMYDALAKGFVRATGDVCAYINADDFYQPHAFATVCQIFHNMDCQWLTGINAIYNFCGQIVDVNIPFYCRAKFIQKGFYNGTILPFIQQESTFWTMELMQYVDFMRLGKMKLAGDYYLWKCFSEHAELYIVKCILSGFRKRRGQLSEAGNAYRQEVNSFCSGQPNWIDKIQILLDKVKGRFPMRFNPNMICFDFKEEGWQKYQR